MKRSLYSSIGFLLLAFLWMALGTGIIGCGGETTVHPPLVVHDIAAHGWVQPDSTILMYGEVELNYRGAGGCVLYEEDSSVGCFGMQPDRDEYQVGDMNDIENATVSMNGRPLMKSDRWRLGLPFMLPEDQLLPLRTGDAVHFVIQVPNQAVESVEDIVLPPVTMPVMPEEGTVFGLQDTITVKVPLGIDRFFPSYNYGDGVKMRLARLDTVGNERLDRLVFRDERVASGDTLSLVYERVYPDPEVSMGLLYLFRRHIVVGE